MKTYLCLAATFVLLVQITAAQDLITSEDVADCTLNFELDQGKLTGEGADVLEQEIRESRFFLLGEYHNDSGISKLTSALLPILAKNGFSHFAVETGPVSALKLTELGKSKDVKSALFEFYTAQYALTKHIPIPFFGGMEDAEFLERAVDLGFDIWGLDQEYLGGYLFLLEELWKQREFPERYRSQYEAMRKKLLEFYAANDENEEIEVYDQMMNDASFQDFLTRMKNGECRCCPDIVEEIRESCRIYHNWKADLLENLEGRTDLMKSHFREYYETAQEREPKVFIKMGGMHTSRGFTGNADYELGNMIHEIAEFEGAKDLNVGFVTRYYLDEETGEIGDNLEYDSEWVRNMTPLLAQGDTSEWKLIDLRPIKKMWVNRERKLNPQIRELVRSKDYLIIMPPLPEVKKNYREG